MSGPSGRSRLARIGTWDHPCLPWLEPGHDRAALFPGGVGLDGESLRRRLDHLSGHRPPAGLDAVLARAQGVSGPGAARSIARLRAGAPVVLTGQQPVLGGGPFFVWLKAAAAILFAERAEALLGRPVVPVFWVAGDDADIEECRYLSDAIVGRTLRFEGLDDGLPHPVGARAFAPSEAEFLAREVEGLWPGSGLPDLLRGRTGISDAFAAVLRRWFEERGLVVVDAGWPELRAASAPVYARFAADPVGVHQALSVGIERATSAGLPVSIGSWPERARLFHFGPRGRQRLVLTESGWFAGAERVCGSRELAEAVLASPERFGHDVISRPFAAESLLPVAGHVLGPGEFGYFATLGPLSIELARPLSPVAPRLSCTLLPAGASAQAAAAGWNPAERPPRSFRAIESVLLERLYPGEAVRDGWATARSAYLRALTEPVDGIAALGDSTRRIERVLGRLEDQQYRLLQRARRGRHSAKLAGLSALWRLAGAGALQERSLGYWALGHHLRHPGFDAELLDLLDPLDPIHPVLEVQP